MDTVLAVPLLPVLLIAIGASDRDSVIYPLRKLFSTVRSWRGCLMSLA
jgi:hypothetical protein